MADAKRYRLVEQGSNRMLVSPSSFEILKAVNAGGAFSYAELSEASGVPLASIYVFCQRLEKAKLVKRSHVMRRAATDGVRRLHAVVKRVGRQELVFPQLRIIR